MQAGISSIESDIIPLDFDPTPAAPVESVASTPRGSFFRMLAPAMVAAALVAGIAFPTLLASLGVQQARAFSPVVVGVAVGIALVVGTVNLLIVRWFVGRRMHDLGARMRKIGAALERAALHGDWSRSHPERWRLVADAEAGLGEVAASFNLLVDALMRARAIDGAIRAYATTLARHIEVAPLAQATLAEVLARTDAAAGAVVVNRGGQLDVAGSIGLQNPLLLLRSELVLRAMRERSTIRLDIADDVVVHGGLIDFRPREVVALPIVFLDGVLGVLVVAGAQPFSAGTVDLLDVVRQGFGVALNNALAHEQQQILAAIDGLTGIYNRRFGFQRLREEISQAHRCQAPLGVLMIDIDHFKAINDAHGHLVGDRVLRHVANLVRGALRLGDVVARYGGEELMVVLRAASPSAVAEIGERLRRTIASKPLTDPDASVAVTVSVGGACYPDHAKDAEALVGCADRALYRAKSSGRNRAVIAG